MIQPIWKSRKFVLLVLDVAVSTATYFIGKYANPDLAKDLLFLIGAYQPIFVALITAYTVQNVEAMRQGK